jgi:hypothetical protein
MGRSRGGLTTKLHAVVDANGNPITLKLTEGQAHDGRMVIPPFLRRGFFIEFMRRDSVSGRV